MTTQPTDTVDRSTRDAGSRVESCDAGAGQCQQVLAECADREPGTAYCDAGDKRRVCIDAMSSKALPCGDLERCVVMHDQTVSCRCVTGAVDDGSGLGCKMGTSCDVENGGCDTHTTCTPAATGRVCGPCPTGYVGEGRSGCYPQLQSLRLSCGELQPVLTAGIYDYRLVTPLVCQTLHMDLSAPTGVNITVDGKAPLDSAGVDVIPNKQGETAISIEAASDFSVTTRYKLQVERKGGQDAYIKASNAEMGDMFGLGMTTNGELLFASAPYEDSASSTDLTSNAAQNSGAVYVFGPQNNAWAQQAYLKPMPVRAGEYFGSHISADGDTLAIGAPSGDPLQFYAGVPGASAGAVYIFGLRNGAWTQLARLTSSSGNAGDMFGDRVLLQGDSLLVGAPGDGSVGSRSGAAYLFTRSQDTWTEKQKLKPSTPVANAAFGLSLAKDATRIVVGAPRDSTLGENAGSAYVFVDMAGTFTEEQHLEAQMPAASTTFGFQVAVSGNTVLVGAPAVVDPGPPGRLHSYALTAGHWTLTQTLAATNPNMSDLFGGQFALSKSLLVVGANGDSSGGTGLNADPMRTDSYQSGAVYLYVRSADDTWLQTAYLKAANPDSYDVFGDGVERTDKAIFIAAPWEGSASRGIGGDQSNNGAYRSGAVYVFR
jgi:hypothetical protein